MPITDLGLSEPLVRALSQFDEATPVQVAAIPAALAGRDLLVTARTGSGKTTAFVLPILEKWLAAVRSKPKRLHALILVPTRELAAQVREVMQGYARELPERIKVVSAVGGVSINPQMMALRGGADVIVATPGRLLDLVDHNAVSLEEVGTLVLDEADRMLDLGFADELLRILSMLPDERQNLFFSATFPEKIESIACDFLCDPKRIEIESGLEEIPDIEQRAIRVDTAKRTPLLRRLIAEEKWERVLVFVGRKYTADHVADKLHRNGIEALSLHGDLSQGARSEVLRDFKSGEIQVLVATDLAARGLDIVRLPVVVNYELPRSPANYIHRIGRTGRAGEKGVAVSFVTAEAAAHFNLIEKRNGLSLTREVISGFEPTDLVPKASGTGGVKGRRKSKKDKLREAAARKARDPQS
ncbi:MAG: RNA helicase [Verrucomicrobiaceae bacterium TMED86]|nr:MAG: RNA helicase [Verrucomicrobiaceae bacterium TMED86]